MQLNRGANRPDPVDILFLSQKSCPLSAQLQQTVRRAMNAPDFSIAAQASVKSPEANIPQPSRPKDSGHSLDDVATLFPGMEVFHDLRIAGRGDATLLCGISGLLNGQNAKIVHFSLRGGHSGESNIKCRLAGLSSSAANDLVAELARRAEVTSARVEHVILRSK